MARFFFFFLFFFSKDSWQFDFWSLQNFFVQGWRNDYGDWLLKSCFFSAHWSQWLFPRLECYIFKHLLYCSVEWSNSPCLFLFVSVFFQHGSMCILLLNVQTLGKQTVRRKQLLSHCGKYLCKALNRKWPQLLLLVWLWGHGCASRKAKGGISLGWVRRSWNILQMFIFLLLIAGGPPDLFFTRLHKAVPAHGGHGTGS